MGQVINKLNKGEATREQVDKLVEEMKPFIDKVYKEDLQDKEDIKYNDLYHAVYKIIEELRNKKGAMQYKLPSKDELKKAFGEFKKPTGPLTKEECSAIIKSLVNPERFSIGQGAIDILLYLFAVPMCALMAKRVIPGMRSISDDVVIPIATSGSVVFLVKSHKL